MIVQKLFLALFTTCFVLLLATIQSSAQQPADGIRVMSYNIRYDNPEDGINRWDNRKERVANLIRFHKVDLFGLQEAEYQQVKYLAGKFEEFEWSGVGRTDGKKEGEFSPVFYNTDRFERQDSGTFWLSDTPQKPSTGWDAALPRIVSWVKLEVRESGSELFFFNTHFDHRGEKARRESASLILEKIEEISGNDHPVILTGDFNATPDSKPYAVLAGELQEAMQVSRYPHYGPEATFLAEDGPFNVGSGEGGRRIDYIFVNRQVEVTHHGIISTFRDGRFPSDHLPVLAEVLLK